MFTRKGRSDGWTEHFMPTDMAVAGGEAMTTKMFKNSKAIQHINTYENSSIFFVVLQRRLTLNSLI